MPCGQRRLSIPTSTKLASGLQYVSALRRGEKGRGKGREDKRRIFLAYISDVLLLILLLVLLKGIEVMFPLTEMEGGASNDTYYINALMSQFLTHLDKLANDDTDAVVVCLLSILYL